MYNIRYIIPVLWILLFSTYEIESQHRDGNLDDNAYYNKDYYPYEQDMIAPPEKNNIGKLLITTSAFYFLGSKIESKRACKKLKQRHFQQQKSLYQQYYNDVYALQEQNADLSKLVEQLKQNIKQVKEEVELDQIQRDYNEFKMPDLDDDDRISHAEFKVYIETYLKNYPGLEEKDYPKFEDFDHSGDGYISFKEYGQQMALLLAKADKEQSNKK